MSKLIMGENAMLRPAAALNRARPIDPQPAGDRLVRPVCDAVREQIAIDHEAAMKAREAGPISRSSMPMAAAHSWKSNDLAEGCRRISNESPIT